MDNNLVTAQWLSAHLFDDTVCIVDGSWHLPTADRNAAEEFNVGHIPGAVYFDIDKCSEAGSLPHMLPTAVEFAKYASMLGITADQHVVVYDTVGVFSAARVWWMFRHYGVKQVSVLNGGMLAWHEAGLEITSEDDLSDVAKLEPQSPDNASASSQGVSALNNADLSPFNASVDDESSDFQVVNAKQVLEATTQSNTVIVDARAPGRFSGAEKEFRPGLRSGHIPNSANVPFSSLLDNGYFKPDEALREIFNSAGVSDDTQVITSCGSGVTAAVLCLALERIGIRNVALYDGSWSEWGGLEEYPVEVS